MAPTRPRIPHTPAITGEKLQNKASCVRPRHSSLLTAPVPTSPLTSITLLPLLCEPQSVPQSIQNCLFHPWFTCTMTDRVCTTMALGHSKPDDTTIAHGTTGRAAGVVREKRKRMSLNGEEEAGIRKKARQDSDALVKQTAPEGLVDICCRKQSFLVRDWHVVSIDSVVISVTDHTQALNNRPVLAETIQEREKILSESSDPVTVSLSDFTQALEIQNHPYLVEAMQQLEKMLSKSRGRVMVSDSFLSQAIDILRNSQALAEATQQLGKILSGSRDARILASKILSRLSSAEMVLLSCTTTFNREDLSTLTDWQRSGNWFDEKEEKDFCLKFSYFMPGRWDPGDIIDKWATFYKVCHSQAGIAV